MQASVRITNLEIRYDVIDATRVAVPVRLIRNDFSIWSAAFVG